MAQVGPVGLNEVLNVLRALLLETAVPPPVGPIDGRGASAKLARDYAYRCVVGLAQQRAEEEQRQRELGRDSVQVKKLVAIWNSRAKRGARPSSHPTREAAMLAGMPWLSYQCPACRAVGEVNLRMLSGPVGTTLRP